MNKWWKNVKVPLNYVNMRFGMTNVESDSHPALKFNVEAQCHTTKARVSSMTLPHSVVETPVFMPVGTAATLKGVLPEQLKALGCQIMLSNTYHLGTRPGAELIEQAGGVHRFMNWDRSLLTDSGGFQMVSP